MFRLLETNLSVITHVLFIISKFLHLLIVYVSQHICYICCKFFENQKLYLNFFQDRSSIVFLFSFLFVCLFVCNIAYKKEDKWNDKSSPNLEPKFFSYMVWGGLGWVGESVFSSAKWIPILQCCCENLAQVLREYQLFQFAL